MSLINFIKKDNSLRKLLESFGQLALAHETGQLTKGASVKILVDNFGDEATLPTPKSSIRKTAQEDFVELYDEVFSNDSPLSDH
jgi:hypothetical protein